MYNSGTALTYLCIYALYSFAADVTFVYDKLSIGNGLPRTSAILLKVASFLSTNSRHSPLTDI